MILTLMDMIHYLNSKNESGTILIHSVTTQKFIIKAVDGYWTVAVNLIRYNFNYH